MTGHPPGGAIPGGPTDPDPEDRPNPRDAQAARHLAGQAMHQVRHVSGREPVRETLRWLTRGRLGRRNGWPVIPVLGSAWQDTVSPERTGWRCRAAYLFDHEDSDDGQVFAVDYRICRRCRLGWVEHPYTVPRYERCGLASAGLAALRAEYPGLEWHTLGGHFTNSQPFWAAVGANVPGGYQQRPICQHITAG